MFKRYNYYVLFVSCTNWWTSIVSDENYAKLGNNESFTYLLIYSDEPSSVMLIISLILKYFKYFGTINAFSKK